MEEKQTLDWNSRLTELEQLLDKHRRNDGGFDVLVPVSGGKDGSYVAYNLKHKFKMNPLAITVTPALPLSLGEKNLKAFIDSGYNHISVNPACKSMRTLNKTDVCAGGRRMRPEHTSPSQPARRCQHARRRAHMP